MPMHIKILCLAVLNWIIQLPPAVEPNIARDPIAGQVHSAACSVTAPP
jgi:hypothetical protein